MDRADVLQYFLEIYFGDDRVRFAEVTGYPHAQVDRWLDGGVQPQRGTLEYVMHCALAPEFKIICEYVPFEPQEQSKDRRNRVREILGDHAAKRGIYAFYDSAATLLYIGKTDNNLLDEIHQSLKQKVNRNFGLQRWNLVRYFSAYYVGGTSSFDYPNHVESLMLRISRPRLNTSIGQLEALPHREE